MRKNINSLVLSIFCAILLLFTIPSTKVAAQCMTYPVNIEEKEKNASIIALGKLKTQHSYWDEQQSRIYTLHIIEVTAYFKGNNGAEEIGLITTGGSVGTDILQVSPPFDIYPYNEYIFFLKGNDQTIDHKEIRKKHPELIQSETYADAQGAITKQFGFYSELHNRVKYTEQEQFERIIQLTKQSVTAPNGKTFLPRTSADSKSTLKEKHHHGEHELNPNQSDLIKDLNANPSFSLLPINVITPNPTHSGTVDSDNYISVTGSGFGNNQGTVFYTNADDGGQTMVGTPVSSDVVSWSSTFVQDKVHQNAGTGSIQINGINSATPLQIDWSHNCIYEDFSGYSEITRQKFFLVDMNNQGGYTFRYNTNFKNNTAAKAAFERAFESWRCGTYVNWQISSNTTSISSAANDNTNIITFNSGIPAGILGRSYSYYSGQATGACNQENTIWWTREVDIEFNTPPTGTTSWNFGPGASTAFALTYDFESVCLHELGHLHGLGHTIDEGNDAMHSALTNGIDVRTLSVNDIAAGDAKLDYSSDPDEYCFTPNNFNGEMTLLNNTTCSLSGGCVPIVVNITGDSEFCEGETVTLNAGSYSSSDSYDWSNGADTQIITVNVGGTYTVEVTDVNDCTGLGAFTVTQNNAPQPNIGGDFSYCSGESTQINAGAFYNSYLWSTGATSFAITISTPGVYTVNVSDANNCVGTDEVTVIEQDLPQPQITGESGFCPDKMVELFAGDGFETYLWSTGETTPSIEADTEGDYSVTVTNNNDCSNTDTYFVTAYTSPTPEIEGNTIFCNGETTSLSVDAGFNSYLWSNGADTFDTSVSESGTYTITVSDNNGCTATAEITVEEQDIPNPEMTGSIQICTGSSTELTAKAGFVAYLWSTDATTPNITVSTAGTYTVEVTDVNNCTGTETVTVTLAEELSPSIEGQTEICEGESTTLTLSQPYETYLWSNDATTPTIEVNESGTYTVEVTDENGCTGTDLINIAVNDLPEVSIAGKVTFCEGESTTLSISGIYKSILWSTNDTGTAITVSETGDYSVTVTNNNDCTAMATVTVIENENPNIANEGAVQICEGESTELSVPAIYDSYLWSNEATTPIITVSEAGIYSIEVTDENGCVGTHEITVSVFANPETTISGSTTFCTGGKTTLDAGEGFETYLWNTGETSRFILVSTADTYSVEVGDENGCSSTANIEVSESGTLTLQIAGSDSFCEGESSVLDAGEGFVSYLWNTGATSRFITANSAETYSVEVEDTNGCIGNGSITMNMFSKPQINMSGNPIFCEGESTVLDAGNGYKTYLWNTGETSQSIEVTEAGTYTVTVTNEEDCSHSENIEVNALPIPKPSITGDVFFCEGESTVLNAGAGFETYLWNTGEIGQFITVSEADTYSVEVTNQNNCIGSTSIETNVYDLPDVSIVGSTSFCQGSNTTLSVAGNFIGYLWNTGETSKSILVDTEGTYSVEVIDQNGCKNTEEVEVEKTANLTPTIIGDLDFCEGNFTLLDAGVGYFSHSWSTGASSRMINVSEGGTYSVVVTDANGCTGKNEVTVTAFVPTIPNIEGNSSFCLGESTTLDAGEGFESYIWNTGETSQIITVTTGGTFSVQTKDFNGCSSNAAINIQEETAVMPIILGEAQFCVGTSTLLEVVEGFDNYLWNTGETSRIITVTEAGFYEVEVIDENGCVATNGVNVSTLEALTPTIEGELQFCSDSNTTLEAPLGYEEYQWSTGETSRIITVSESGNYGVLVTDSNGCT
ncbi:MAG: matrixin family metalloprotease, partial [Chitinophagales bacterium]